MFRSRGIQWHNRSVWFHVGQVKLATITEATEKLQAIAEAEQLARQQLQQPAETKAAV